MQTRPVTETGADAARFRLGGPAGLERRRLLYEGRDVGSVAGEDLVAHFRVAGAGWLIVTDCDCPYEEMVYFHLLGGDFRRIETRHLGGIYAPGIVDDVRQEGPNRFSLTFPDAAVRQRITVEPRRAGWLRLCRRWVHIVREPASGRR